MEELDNVLLSLARCWILQVDLLPAVKLTVSSGSSARCRQEILHAVSILLIFSQIA
jgi:hypothetical protein